jgi:cysteinyl-tRNA synthetase
MGVFAMELKLYDTLTREKRVFSPIDPSRLRIYVCGPTVYDFAHIGNARPVIVFDVLFRLLRHIYRPDHVTYVRNVTDVDDKINARAAERGVSIRDLTEETFRNFKEDVAALGCLEPTVEPRATEHIEAMTEIIERLVKAGCAYVAEEHVLFHVASMKDYGKLSNRSLDEMIAGSRVEVAPYKKDPMDFVLWKPSKPGEPAWPSPAGIKTPGRPGWHIECSAMAWKHLGETFDIHGGGIDLVFPHHENEIAQSRCAFHTKVMANYWMHNGFLQVEGEKMSKSLGNFVTIHELLKDWAGEVVRLNMLRTHYRQPMDWTVRGLQESDKVLQNWIDVLGKYQTSFTDTDLPSGEALNALCDDLNTPRAIAEMHRLSSLGGLLPAQELHQSLKLLGLVSHASFTRREKSEIVRAGIGADERQRIDALVNLRAAARKSKDFKESDRIRDQLLAMGVRLKDNPDGTTTSEFTR